MKQQHYTSAPPCCTTKQGLLFVAPSIMHKGLTLPHGTESRWEQGSIEPFAPIIVKKNRKLQEDK